MSEAVVKKKKPGLMGSFPRSFWVVNVMELFERGAYYGMNSVLAVYLTQKGGGGLGFAKANVGFLLGLVYAITYIFPIIGGALADRYGYRRMLLIAFSLLSTGYFATAFVNDYWMVFLTLGIMAVGSGLFKPIISGTIARTTDEKTSGFGFGVYYWMINMGALVAPLIIYYLRGISWRYVFLFSGCATAAMFIPTLFIYKDPDKPSSTKNIREVLRGAVTVLSDSRFMLMVFLYSIFWILYFQNFGTVLWYLRDFIDPTPVNNLFASMGVNYSFRPEHVTVINAGTIVLLQVLISFLTKKIRPLPTMMTGMFIGSLGFLFLALSSSVWVFIAGITVFSIGEMTCHPKYVSYIGLIAPSDKKAIYMGYAFIYGVIGSLVGSNVGAELYDRFLTPLASGCSNGNVSSTLRNFWMTFGILGLFSMGGLFLFHKFIGKDSEVTRRRARRIMIGAYTFFVVAGVFFIGTRVVSIVAGTRGVRSGHTPTSLVFSPDGKTLYSGGWDGSLARWDTQSHALMDVSGGCVSQAMWSVEVAEKPGRLLMGTKAGDVEEWNLASQKVEARYALGKQDIWSVVRTSAGVVKAAEGTHNGLRIWDVQSRKLLVTLEAKVGRILSARFVPGSDLILAGSADGSVRLWDTQSGRLLGTLAGHSSPVLSVTPSGKHAVTASMNEVILWDLNTFKRVNTLDYRTLGIARGSVSALALTADGQTLAVGREDGAVTLWAVPANRRMAEMRRPEAATGIGENLKKSAKTFLQALILITIGFLGLWAGWSARRHQGASV